MIDQSVVFFNCPSAVLYFCVFVTTFFLIVTSSNFLMRLVSTYRCPLVALVDSSSVVVVWSFLRYMLILMSSIC